MYNDSRTLGLHVPATASDACGVGAVCTLHDPPSHRVVRLGLDVLVGLEHRGACGCDPLTGDGAGILIGVPDRFFRAWAEGRGIDLPAEGAYGVGMLFLPPDPEAAAACRRAVDAEAAHAGLGVLGWRAVPVHPDGIGAAARARQPAVWQVVVGGGALRGDDLERALLLLRRRAERRVDALGLDDPDAFYVVSLSARTLVYKGMLTVEQVPRFYPDLADERLESRFAVVHSRFSTNTLPAWRLAQPFRLLCHNGEINTLRGNVNGMRVREARFGPGPFGDALADLLPVLREGDSDSAALDGTLELLRAGGRALPHAMMMLVPEAWEGHDTMSPARRAFYAYHACLMEPWDGPAGVLFADGRYVGGTLDRNGLRPARFTVTDDGLVVLASEAGVLDLDPARIVRRGRLEPGRMFLVDLEAGRIVEDDELKETLAAAAPYAEWLRAHLRTERDLPTAAPPPAIGEAERLRLQQRFGYTLEDLRTILAPMAAKGKEALGSMGDDTPLAVLSTRPRLLYDYFRQLFAQVTNPPLDALREALVTSLHTDLGPEGDLFSATPEHARRLRLASPVLDDATLAAIRAMDDDGFRAATLPLAFDAGAGGAGLEAGLDALGRAAEAALDAGATILVLSDRDVPDDAAPIPALLATGAVHHHLIRTGRRGEAALVVETGEAREVHHLCTLIGYGAHAVNPYLALATARGLAASGAVHATPDEAAAHYLEAASAGVLKVMSKMGISTLHAYRGAQIFEAVGLGHAVVDRAFTGTPSRLGGVGFDGLADDVRARLADAEAAPGYAEPLDVGGRYGWRRGGEEHAFHPITVARLQHAVRGRDAASYAEYAAAVNAGNRGGHTLRGLLDFVPGEPVPLDEVEPWTAIVTRFKTGAMSYGSISKEAHEALAEAMNAVGGRSNTGEGGEDPARYDRASPRRSRIKQVASGRFGVTAAYLASADEIQIKMAQGAKPGEGGQLPGEKVYPWIAETRHSTPWVGLISPPPHHDIYSIEDLAQLIHDLKNANPAARVTVKLVAEVGVGTVAVGVAKGKADVVLISGHDGGTGASPQTSVMHAGLPWELGLAEAHQALVQAGLRSRIRVECDGGLKTGRDVAVAALLGADEFGFATAPLVALGCIMMRKCHLNTCPVGIATQNPALRARFAGQPEHVVNYVYFVAEELRALMAELGFRTVDEMVGRADRLRPRTDVDHPKARHLDLAPLVAVPEVPEGLRTFATAGQDHRLGGALDHALIAAAAPALERGERVVLDVPLRNTNRTVGTMLSGEVARRHGEAGLPDDTVTLRFTGAAGQSFFAFGARGLTAHVEGEANDYFGKGLSGARLAIRPPRTAAFRAEAHTLIGNVALYGATSGEVFVRGLAGERFAVRNSGAVAVVEGVGDHGCEYMTGGTVVVLGPTGRNFAAGMSGGTAYVLDRSGAFRTHRCNRALVDLEPLEAPDDLALFFDLVARHHALTDSDVAAWVLAHRERARRLVVKVIPVEYRRALERLRAEDDAEHRAA